MAMPAFPSNGELVIRLLGRTPGLSVGARAIVLPVPRRALALFAYLLLRREPVARDDAAFALWPECTEREARANLRRHLHLLQGALPEASVPWILTDHRSIAWNREAAFSIDVAPYEEPAWNPSLSETVEAVESDEELFATLDDEWIAPFRERFRKRHLQALETQARAARERGELAPTMALAGRILSIDPWREDVVRLLMRTRAEAGDRAGALALYREFAARLREELAVEPTSATTAEFETIAKLEAPRALAHAPGGAAPLPEFISSLHGREAEIEELRAALRERRIVTLVGTGGVGKTRLAVETALREASVGSAPASFVDLAPLEDGALVANRVALALGVREREGDPLALAADAIGDRTMLLVLDNCEHVVAGAAATVQRLLRVAPGLRVLATSREALRIEGEWRFEVAPLPSGFDGSAPSDVLQSPAVQLFLDRAADCARGRDFSQHFESIARICARLDGLPLAIELAAARVRSMPLSELERRLSDRLALLNVNARTAPRRQATLEAAIDWSYSLLSEPDRRVLRRIGVFRGAFDFAAAEALVDPGDRADLNDRLSALVGQSLLVLTAEPGWPERYRLLETTRAYAMKKLEASGELAECRSQHARYFAGVAERLRRKVDVLPEAAWLASVAAERDNLNAALEAAERDRATALEGAVIATALAEEWLALGHESLGIRRLERIVELPLEDARIAGLAWCALAALYRRSTRSADSVKAAQRAVDLLQSTPETEGLAHAVSILAHCSISLPSANEETFARSRTLMERALELAARLESPARTAECLFSLAVIEYYDDRYDRSIELFRRARALFASLGKQGRTLHADLSIAIVAHALGDGATAHRIARECLAIAEPARLDMVTSLCNELVGLVELDRGELELARLAFCRALEAARPTLSDALVDMRLRNFALLFAAAGRDTLAATVLGYVERARENGTHADPPLRRRIDAALQADLRDRLGANDFDREFAGGGALPRGTLISLVLGLADHPIHASKGTNVDVSRTPDHVSA